jgi:type IV secretory pathway VirB2 component (pilin)
MKDLNKPSCEQQVRAYLAACVLTAISAPVYAQLTEVEGTATWVLDIFSPALLLILLTILLIGCGLAVFFGRMSGAWFFRILIGSILIFGARTIAPKLIAVVA